MHFEIISVTATQPNTGAAGVVTATLDKLTIGNATESKGVYIIAGWGSRQTAGYSQFYTPSAHDTSRGYRTYLPAAVGTLSLPLGARIPLTPQEVLQSNLSGSNTSGDIELDSWLVWYGDQPGISARLLSPDEVARRTERVTSVCSTITAVATGAYAEEAMSTDSDLLKANRDYAVLGFSSDLAAHALTIKGPDLGNVRVGCPGVLRPELTASWFVLLSRAQGKNLIPVINSGNRANTLLGFSANENAANTTVTAHLALLRS
jgi:hypothetical protein